MAILYQHFVSIRELFLDLRYFSLSTNIKRWWEVDKYRVGHSQTFQEVGDNPCEMQVCWSIALSSMGQIVATCPFYQIGMLNYTLIKNNV